MSSWQVLMFWDVGLWNSVSPRRAAWEDGKGLSQDHIDSESIRRFIPRLLYSSHDLSLLHQKGKGACLISLSFHMCKGKNKDMWLPLITSQDLPALVNLVLRTSYILNHQIPPQPVAEPWRGCSIDWAKETRRISGNLDQSWSSSAHCDRWPTNRPHVILK